MFNFLKKKNLCLYAPVTGKSIPLSEVPDEVFAKKMMGDGLGFILENDQIAAPCDGTVMMIAETKHALGIKARNGAEIMIHIGLDTVNLGGEGFKLLVAENQQVKAGDPLIEIDRAFMEEKKVNLITPMIITDAADHSFTVLESYGDVVKGVSKVIEFE